MGKLEVSPIKHVHGHVLQEKSQNSNDPELNKAFSSYVEFRRVVDELNVMDSKAVLKLVDAINNYRVKTLKIFEERDNSGQEILRSTILEELFSHLFKDLVHSYIKDPGLVIGKGESYVSLSFTPRTFQELFEEPYPYIHTKDQDFLLGSSVILKVIPFNQGKVEETPVTIPVLAIECKTYLERNMLDACASTARRLKSAMPYCMYIIASEYLKMDEAYPELTDIDEVFILCKASNSDREERKRKNHPPHDIDGNLIYDLFEMVAKHFNRVWWDPTQALNRGKVINRP